MLPRERFGTCPSGKARYARSEAIGALNAMRERARAKGSRAVKLARSAYIYPCHGEEGCGGWHIASGRGGKRSG